jgi:hemoglobin-like flavoprotein
LFKADMTERGRKLMAMIGTAVANPHRPGEILPAVRDLGKRHAGYGVKTSHCDTVANALLWTLEQGLGADFTPATRDAWAACHGAIPSEMKAAATL